MAARKTLRAGLIFVGSTLVCLHKKIQVHDQFWLSMIRTQAAKTADTVLGFGEESHCLGSLYSANAKSPTRP